MHDPKFESAVQEKMERLEFIPSESVWENIEMAVAQRRRRAVPLFVWFLLAGLLLVGAGTAIYLRKDNQSVARNISVPAGTAALKNTSPATGAQDATGAPNTTATQSMPSTPAATDQFSAADGTHRITPFSPVTSRDHGAGLTAGTNPTTPAAGTTDANPATTAAARQHFVWQPGLINCSTSLSGIKGPGLSPASATKTAVTGIPRPKRPWSAGFAGGLGISSYNESLLTTRFAAMSYAAAVPASSAAQYLPAVITSNNTSSKKITSTVKAGLSYWAGIAVQKPLSARLSLSLGLDLHYYSSGLRIGGVVTTYSRSSTALIGSSALASVQTYPYYSVGDVQVYTNRYYYLELPVAMQWQINRGRVLPLFLRGGVTLSRLMSSNGLYYNDQSAVYFRDNAVIQPIQVSFTSALVATLPLRGIRIQTGPEMQYGATALLKGGAGNGHLLYGGLRITIMR